MDDDGLLGLRYMFDGLIWKIGIALHYFSEFAFAF